jgi:hypothetical protein
LIGDRLDHEAPGLHRAGDRFGWPVGVYALGHRHPLNGHFDVDYVGSSVRLAGDVGDRVREHLRDVDKAEVFTDQVLLPLRPDLAESEVRRLEGVVARALGVPRWCARVPGGKRLAVG